MIIIFDWQQLKIYDPMYNILGWIIRLELAILNSYYQPNLVFFSVFLIETLPAKSGVVFVTMMFIEVVIPMEKKITTY